MLLFLFDESVIKLKTYRDFSNLSVPPRGLKKAKGPQTSPKGLRLPKWFLEAALHLINSKFHLKSDEIGHEVGNIGVQVLGEILLTVIPVTE